MCVGMHVDDSIEAIGPHTRQQPHRLRLFWRRCCASRLGRQGSQAPRDAPHASIAGSEPTHSPEIVALRVGARLPNAFIARLLLGAAGSTECSTRRLLMRSFGCFHLQLPPAAAACCVLAQPNHKAHLPPSPNAPTEGPSFHTTNSSPKPHHVGQPPPLLPPRQHDFFHHGGGGAPRAGQQQHGAQRPGKTFDLVYHWGV